MFDWMKCSILKDFLIIIFICLAVGYLGGCGSGGGTASTSGSVVNIGPPASITADAGKERVILNWSPVINAISFNVYYSTLPGVTKANGIKVEDQHGPYTARDLTDGTPYYFVITSVNDTGESDISREVSATPSATPPPYAPTNVTAEAGAGQVQVSWTASSGATSYNVYYRASPGVTIANGTKVTGAANPSVIGPLTNGVTYYFVVTAVNANGESTTSFETCVTPLASPPAAPPTGLTAVEGNQQATITWTAVAGATSYNLYYATELTVTKTTGTKIAGVTSPCIITSLTNKMDYYFVITSVNDSGESAASSKVSATPLASTPVPAMILIPAGSFRMGDNLDGTTYAMPVHTVSVSNFYIDKYETIYSDWKIVYDWAVTHGYTFDNLGMNGSNNMGTNMPVTSVSWYDVVKWLNARSEKEGLTPCYYTDVPPSTVYRTGQVNVANNMVKWTANGYRLPTEAEWEKAERGGVDDLRYPWGNDLGTGNANYNMGRTVSIGIYPPNGYGLYDTAGNVWEWTWDWGVSANGYSNWEAWGSTDPHGPDASSTSTRVRRGGGYSYGYQYLRCFERMFRVPTYTAAYFGFRSVSNQP